MPIRQPIVVVLGHVDHGKTTILDKIRGTAVASREAGAISQHIGASFVPKKVMEEACGELIKLFKVKITVSGLLFIDTPGHSAFSNLRRRGGSVADIAILVIDLNEGVKPQTVESINILTARRTPFVIAANKLDLIKVWHSSENGCFIKAAKLADPSVLRVIDEKIYSIIGTLSTHKLNAERFDRVENFQKTIAMVPVSAKTGEGIPDLLTVLLGLIQQYMKKQLKVTSGPAKGTILEVREDIGLGMNINAIIYDGVLHENDQIVVGGWQKPFSTKIRTILIPKPLDEIRDPREKFKKIKEVPAAAGVKIIAPGLDDAMAGSALYVVPKDESPDKLLQKIEEEIESIKISTDKLGVVVKTDTLGSLEALVNELKTHDVPIRIANVGDVCKRDVVEASVVKAEAPTLGTVLSFNVKILPDALNEAMKDSVKLFQYNVIYQLLEEYHEWVRSEEEEKAQRTFDSLIKPGKVKLLQGYVFRRNNPAIFGVEVLAGKLTSRVTLIKSEGTQVGKVAQLQERSENLTEATKGMQVAVSMKEPTVGRQIRENDTLHVDVPEGDLKVLLQQFKEMLTQDDLDCLNEFIKAKRKRQPHFGFGIEPL